MVTGGNTNVPAAPFAELAIEAIPFTGRGHGGAHQEENHEGQRGQEHSHGQGGFSGGYGQLPDILCCSIHENGFVIGG